MTRVEVGHQTKLGIAARRARSESQLLHAGRSCDASAANVLLTDGLATVRRKRCRVSVCAMHAGLVPSDVRAIPVCDEHFGSLDRHLVLVLAGCFAQTSLGSTRARLATLTRVGHGGAKDESDEVVGERARSVSSEKTQNFEFERNANA